MHTVEFEVHNHKIIGKLTLPSQSKSAGPAILFVHGWTSAQSRFSGYMEELSKYGYVCMSFDMEGHGETGGDLETLIRKDFLDDVIAAYDFLSHVKEVDKEQISIVGSSFGSYLGSILTSYRQVSKLVLRVPADYKDDGFEKTQLHQDNKEWRKVPHSPSESKALNALHNFNGETLIIESEKDEEVDKQTIKNYLNAVKDRSKLKHIVMKDAPHSINRIDRFLQEFKEILVKFFT